MTWFYNGNLFEIDDDRIDDLVGFVYCITEIETGMKYVGKKLFWRKLKRPPLKGKTRKRTEIVQSDWVDYYGSSDRVSKLVEELGTSAFHREILHLCRTKGECSYMEAQEQFARDVLRRDDYYNGIINCRINAKHLPKPNPFI